MIPRKYNTFPNYSELMWSLNQKLQIFTIQCTSCGLLLYLASANVSEGLLEPQNHGNSPTLLRLNRTYQFAEGTRSCQVAWRSQQHWQ
jgi:hypothetical protein